MIFFQRYSFISNASLTLTIRYRKNFRGGGVLSKQVIALASAGMLWIPGAPRKFIHSLIKIHNLYQFKLIILTILPTNEITILTKSHTDWVKIVNFFIKSLFLGQLSFFCISPYIKCKNTIALYNLNNSYIIRSFRYLTGIKQPQNLKLEFKFA